jgi:hypothetical protein
MQRQSLRVLVAAIAVLIIGRSASGSTIVDAGAGFASSIATQAYAFGEDTPNAITVLNSSANTYSASQSASVPASSYGYATGSADDSLSTSGGNVGLHGSASASSGVPSGFVGPASNGSYANFEIYSYDLFTFAGSGLETFQYSLVLDGNTSLTASAGSDDNAFASLLLYANSSYQYSGGAGGVVANTSGCGGTIYVDGGLDPSSCAQLDGVSIGTSTGTSPGLPTGPTTVTGTLSVLGGTSLELGLYFTGYVNDTTFYASETAQGQVNAENTGYFTLTPVTPGASFTTASGLTYAADPDSTTPEPASILLLGTGLAVLFAVQMRRRA